MRIFISYRRSDSHAVAQAIHKQLSQQFGKNNIFFDKEDIQAGENFVTALRNAVKNSDIMLVIINTTWLTTTKLGDRRLDDPDDYVRLEVEHAILNGLRVIPILINNTPIPSEDDLPSKPLKELASRNAITINDSDEKFDTDIKTLIQALNKIDGEKQEVKSNDQKQQVESELTELAETKIQKKKGIREWLNGTLVLLATILTIIGGIIVAKPLISAVFHNSSPETTETSTPRATDLPTFTPLPIHTPTITLTPTFTNLPTFTPLPTETP